jgi:predicted ATP-grasp superfamily ATP-dependent carboligase
MKIFVYEYCCCQPQRGGAIAEALGEEGSVMLTAIMSDLARVPDVEAVALVADDMPPVGFSCKRIKLGGERRAFQKLAAEADYTLVIAPETGGLLEERCRWVLDAGGRLLGPSPEAVKLTGDKYALHEHLVARGLPTPPTILLGSAVPPKLLPGVCKPRDGAGSMSTYLVNSSEDVARIIQTKPAYLLLLQRHVRGTPASVAFLIGPRQLIALRPAWQMLSVDGRFRYEGGWAPLRAPLAERARKLAMRAVKSVPGLLGYIGVDLVMGGRVDGKSDRIIEINPRLTTSYIGLRALARNNLVRALLDVVAGRPARVSWRRGLASWTCDGTVVTCGGGSS